MTIPTSAPVPLPHVPRRLAEAFDGRPPSRMRLYDMITRAAIPAESTGTRWYIRETDLPAVARAVGMTPRAAAQAAA